MLKEVLEDESIGQRVYRRLRSDIIFGRLAPGQRLKLERMKERYSTSVSTLRELLNRLSAEGLIVAEGLRGFEVTPVSVANLREVAAMRQLLESHALEQSFAAGDMEWEGRIVSTHHKLSMMEKRMLKGDHSEAEIWKRYDWEFHHALISACGSNALLESHASIYDRYLRYQMIAVVFRGEIAAREHQQLLECALNRDFKKARNVLETHIQDCAQHAIAGGKVG